MNTATFFDDYYHNAEINSMLIMDCDGMMLHVNGAFTNNYGYNNEEIKGLNFSMLFNKRDQEKYKPQLEIETVIAQGCARDENYIICKDGLSIWVIGESILVSSVNGEKYIVKDIVNLQAKKQFQEFLIEKEELLERLFASSKDISMMVLDAFMKVIKVNTAFLKFFELNELPLTGSRLAALDHAFWSKEDIKGEVRNSLVTNQPFQEKGYSLHTRSGEKKVVRIDSKLIDTKTGAGRKLYLLIEELPS
jgi:PAS domain S-box-containing protein